VLLPSHLLWKVEYRYHYAILSWELGIELNFYVLSDRWIEVVQAQGGGATKPALGTLSLLEDLCQLAIKELGFP